LSTKHEKILQYIRDLEVGSKISVRGIAQQMNVSEGTAYRAIKAAENEGYVSTIERVGTVRIQRKESGKLEHLTFAEVVGIVDGHVLGGRDGLYKTLNKFVIGAMKLEAMVKYIEPDSLLIVGNRDNAHRLSLEHGAAVLITGGFDASDEVKRLADQLKLPIISSKYDTYTVASLINRALYDRLIKKDIILIADLLDSEKTSYTLSVTDTIQRWHELASETGHTRYPVVDEAGRVQGIVTAKDVVGREPDDNVTQVMTKNPITVQPSTPIASAAHKMVWEGIELVPVVGDDRQLLGVISRHDVIKALHWVNRMPQGGDTIEDEIVKNMVEVDNGETAKQYRVRVTPQMTNQFGMLSSGVMITLMTEAAERCVKEYCNSDVLPDNMSVYFLQTIQLDEVMTLTPSVIELSRKFAKVEVSAWKEQQLVGKVFFTLQMM
jgi:predicted transcriptional regulator